jgi:chaperone modulatory protein CbpM
MTTALVRTSRLSLESFSQATGLHPELIGRLVRLGLLDAALDPRGQPFFSVVEVARAARIQRLRDDLSLNYAALGVVLDLLDRIDILEAALRGLPNANGGTSRRWTPTA